MALARRFRIPARLDQAAARESEEGGAERGRQQQREHCTDEGVGAGLCLEAAGGRSVLGLGRGFGRRLKGCFGSRFGFRFTRRTRSLEPLAADLARVRADQSLGCGDLLRRDIGVDALDVGDEGVACLLYTSDAADE